jgi:uncharacterized damage-inducible protein DinB
MIQKPLRSCAIAALLTLSAACQQPAPTPAPAPPPPPSTVVRDSLKQQFDEVKGFLVLAADQLPQAKYAFQPTKEVRTFSRIIGHLANENYLYCSAATGAKKPDTDFEPLTNKAELQKALNDAFAFCDRAFAGLDDQTGAASARIDEFNYHSTKFGMLAANTAHNNEHYGNIVTYLRLNHMVPPSSQNRGATTAK